MIVWINKKLGSCFFYAFTRLITIFGDKNADDLIISIFLAVFNPMRNEKSTCVDNFPKSSGLFGVFLAYEAFIAISFF